MKKLLPIFILSLLLTSCATLSAKQSNVRTDSAMMVHWGDEYIFIDPWNHFVNLGNGIQEYEVLYEERGRLNHLMKDYEYFYLTDTEYDIISGMNKGNRIMLQVFEKCGFNEYHRIYGCWQEVRIEIDGEMQERTFLIATCELLANAYARMGYDERSIRDLAYKLIVLR